MNIYSKFLLTSVWLGAAAAVTGLKADTVTVPAAADTFISALNPDFNGGGVLWFDAGSDNHGGVRRGLLKFDLSSLPPGSTVTSAVLTLRVGKVPSLGGASSFFSLRRLNADWGEGNKTGLNGALATNGEATWNARLQSAALWTTAGGLSDAATTVSASTQVTAALGSQNSWSAQGVLDDVWYWQTNAAGNFGWLLVCDNEAALGSVLGFSSHEAGAAGPGLVIGYTPTQTSNSPPIVFLTSPTNGAAFTAPATVTIEANASDLDGTVASVQFFDGASSLGSASADPYRITAGLFPGTHTLSAVATDNLGSSTTSSNVVITVGSVVITNPIAARIPKGSHTIELRTIADGLAAPLGMAVPDDGSGRMFVFDQDGRVWVVTSAGRQNTPLLDLNARLVLLAAYDERGLLGVAAHPDFANHPLVYTYTSEPTNGPADFQNGVTNNHQSVIAEWRISSSNSNAVDVASRREILRVDEPQSNHNGGTMRFGPDGLLYVTLGDGGQANDVGEGHVPGGNAQDIARIWGKIIRVDVDGTNSANGQYGIPANNPFVGTNGLPEIYAYGLRNPFNFSFDRGSGQLYLGDVGQNKVEEVDIITAGGNYGWNLREGGFWFDPSTGNDVTAPVRPPPANMIEPIAQYDHDDGLAVIGGFVYRGSAIPELAGRYVFGDWGSFSAPSGRLFYLDETNGVNELKIGREDRPLGLWIRGFGEGPDGELYVFGSRLLGPAGNTGRMLKILPGPAAINVAGVAVNGTNLNVSWSGGVGPFALQTKSTLAAQTWANAAVTAASSAAVNPTSSSGFYRVIDAANVPRIPFTAYLTGAAEHPTNSSTATGFGIFALDANTLTFNLSYGGLSGVASAAHIHGAADTSSNAPVIIDLSPYNGGAWGASGTVSGVIVLTDAQKALVLAGRTYVNFHTAAFPGGEMRGQIAPVNMQVELATGNELSVVNSAATGLGNLQLVGNQLTFNVSYSGLSGVASASHFHGPANATQNAGVIISLNPYNGGAYGTSGSLSGTVTLTPQQLAWVIDGLTYINFHTAAYPGGEMRGQVLPQVTGVPLTLLLSGLAEHPVLTNTAAGNGSLSLEGNRLTFNVVYGGLSGNATAAHIHGPSTTTVDAGVLINLSPFNGGSFGTSGRLSGSVELTPALRNMVLNGQTYINFHTTANPGGEMRGQVAPVAMTAALSGVNESPSRATLGTGAGTFALVRDQLSLSVVYRNLLSAATASHIHGPAGLTGSAGVILDLGPYNGGAYGSSGVLSGTAPLTVPILLNVVDGQTYVNFHTTNNPSGEIRGQLMR